MYKNGFLKVCAITPKLEVGNPKKNVMQMLECLKNNKASLVVFPELSVTGYSCGDLFFQNMLISDTKEALNYFLAHNTFEGLIALGSPVIIDTYMYNCALIIEKNKILGIIPKKYIPNNYEYYEKRWFRSGLNVKTKTVKFLDQDVLFGDIIFSNEDQEILIGVEICEDMWSLTPPGSFYSMNGVNVMLNLSASNETYGKSDIRKNSVLENSRRNVGAYIYSSAGLFESTSETVFSGHDIIALNGELLAEKENYETGNQILYADIDISGINFLRRNSSHLKEYVNVNEMERVSFKLSESLEYDFEHEFDKLPFIPKDDELSAFKKISLLQEMALLKRISFLNNCKIIIGVSGGLDSTLALLVAVKVCDKLKIDRKSIIAVTMPGLHSSQRTKNNALLLMEKLGVTLLNIDIKDFVKKHFELIEHDELNKDITYENTQARIRTLFLMNLANKYNGIVLGTGDMSELALGFCTYNGDQMSMYGINAGLPKTLVRFMVECYGKYEFMEVLDILKDVVETPISPELTEAKSEDVLGSYEINDFILYRYLNYGDSEERISYILKKTYNNKDFTDDVKRFFQRFFKAQFKRQALPDAPKILNVSLAPRGDYRMPSDIKR